MKQTTGSDTEIRHSDIVGRIQWIQTFTIVWMTAEIGVSLIAAWMAKSPSLVAFGGDSAIELFSAVVVLWRFGSRSAPEEAERRASRIAGALFLFLAAYVIVISGVTLLKHIEPKQSYLGIAILIAATVVMPWLAKEKRRLAVLTRSAALRADAAESVLCAYLSLIALIGLAANAIWHIVWADPVAALVITPVIVWEGRQALLSKCCGGG